MAGSAEGVTNTHTEEVPWIRNPFIEQLPGRTLTRAQDLSIKARLIKRSDEKHTLTIKPNLWMRCFGVITPEEVTATNKRILERVRENELTYREVRAKANLGVLGVDGLMRQAIMKSHRPLRLGSGRKIYFLTTEKELGVAFVQGFRLFCEQCRQAYEAWTRGDWGYGWPLGAFRPAIRPTVCEI